VPGEGSLDRELEDAIGLRLLGAGLQNVYQGEIGAQDENGLPVAYWLT